MNANVIFENENPIDFAPFELKAYDSKEKRNWNIQRSHSFVFHSYWNKGNRNDKKMKSLQR